MLHIDQPCPNQLVTVIEVLSPVNKRPSHEAYLAYQRKRRDILRSEVHLLEIDLLRGGERPPLERPVPPAAYYVVLSRAHQSGTPSAHGRSVASPVDRALASTAGAAA